MYCNIRCKCPVPVPQVCMPISRSRSGPGRTSQDRLRASPLLRPRFCSPFPHVPMLRCFRLHGFSNPVCPRISESRGTPDGTASSSCPVVGHPHPTCLRAREVKLCYSVRQRVLSRRLGLVMSYSSSAKLSAPT
jgi:hypothetical protein